MELVIPTRLTEFELFRKAKEVVSKFNLDETNLNEYPIRAFNELILKLGRTPSAETNEIITNAFSMKGSYESVGILLNLLGIDGQCEYMSGTLNLGIGIEETESSDFIPALKECIGYLLIYDELTTYISTLVKNVKIMYGHRITAIGLDVRFLMDGIN